LVCVPCPENAAVSPDIIEAALDQAQVEAEKAGITGNAITPFILGRLVELTDGATLRANLALLRNNALRGAELAVELVRL
jgi:pseudouridine-5'-phosphate glycosidase